MLKRLSHMLVTAVAASQSPTIFDKSEKRHYEIFSRLLKERIIWITDAVSKNIFVYAFFAWLSFYRSRHRWRRRSALNCGVCIWKILKSQFICLSTAALRSLFPRLQWFAIDIINSWSILFSGGDVSSTLAIYDTMRLVHPPINTWCFGQASSGACLLLAAGEPGSRHCSPNASIMIHEPGWHGTVVVSKRFPGPPFFWPQDFCSWMKDTCFLLGWSDRRRDPCEWAGEEEEPFEWLIVETHWSDRACYG